MGVRLAYALVDGRWRWPRFRIRLRNTLPDRRFFCMLLDLTKSYSVYAGLLPRGGVWLEPSGRARGRRLGQRPQRARPAAHHH